MFDDFVVPAAKDLDSLHQDYMQSFCEYREAISSSDFPLDESHPVLLLIRKDA